jgi:cation:H+ antiporter
MINDVLLFSLGLVLLYFGADFLVRGASQLARLARIRPLVIGVTIVAFGTSAPEMLVSMVAAWHGQVDVAVGNIIGSNIANIGLILGLTGLISVIFLGETQVKREIYWMLAASVVFAVFAWTDSVINHWEGLVLIAGIIVFSIVMIRQSLSDRRNQDLEEVPDEPEGLKKYSPLIRVAVYSGQIVAGIVVLIFGSNITIDSAINIARYLGVSEIVIGLSLVAFGTSLPELATSIISIIRRENAILVGNVVGSNIFNILFVGGVVSTVFEMPLAERVLNQDLPVMLGISFVLVPMIFPKNRLLRPLAGMLLLVYCGYIFYVFSGAL